MGYYIGIAGVQQGPFELNDLPAKGLRPDSLVWTDGMADWKRADQVPEVAALLVARPAKSPESPDPPPGPVPQLQPLGANPLQYQTPAPSQQNGMAVASLVLGILSLPLMCMRGLGLLLGLLAVIFGFIARSRPQGRDSGMALAGIILGFIPVVLLTVIICIGGAFIFSRSSHRLIP